MHPGAHPGGFQTPILNIGMPLKNPRGRCFLACYHSCLAFSVGKMGRKKKKGVSEVDTSETKHRLSKPEGNENIKSKFLVAWGGCRSAEG